MFKKILITYTIIFILIVISLEIYLSSVIKSNYIKNLKNSLLIQSKLIALNIPDKLEKPLDDFCKDFKEKTSARITIIAEDGKVLGDSDEPSQNMENHYNRPEIREADINEIGSSIRFSKTLSTDMFYLAVSINRDDNKKIFLRLSVPLKDIQKAINDLRIKILIASSISLLTLLLITLYQTEKIKKTINEIVNLSKEIATGNLKSRLIITEKDELGDLTKNINEMAQSIEYQLHEIELEKQRLETILKTISESLILVDNKLRVILYNFSFKNLFQIDQDITNKPLIEICRNIEIVQLIEHVIKTNQSVTKEIQTTYPKESFLLVTANPYYSINEESSGAVLTLYDITKLKKLEQIRKDFVANVSHEMKTPITAIKGFAETLLDGAIDDKENAIKFLKTIKTHSERLNSLIDDLLTLSRIELGEIKLEKNNININEAIDNVFNLLSNKAKSKGLYLKKDIDPAIKYINADFNRFQQILLNIIDNGIKFTEKGGVTLKAYKINKDGKEFIEIIVEDTGIGIPKKHLTRIGERFYRVDAERSRNLGGTGLGLAIVKHLIKAHGWEMKIESEESIGTKVIISISP